MRTVVITGGSAGVGKATALAFAKRGWNVAIIARAGLEGAEDQIRSVGGDVISATVDVADSAAIFAAAEEIENWHSIDVWINSAMATIFSPFSKLSPEEFRRATEVSYLGYVYGTMAALKHMRQRDAGTIVQVGSALSYRAIPLQSAYCGAKFAIRGFTDALRSELKNDNCHVRITMVQLPAVNTPQFDWARNKMPYRPQPVPPIHHPGPIADAIFGAAERAPRELWVGVPTVRAILANVLAPGLLDRYLSHVGYIGQFSGEPNPLPFDGNLFDPATDGHKTEGRFNTRSTRQVLSINPAILRMVAGGSLIALAVVASFALLT
jgi:NAD(P)-dependent dehydrogenase (short-subunit alcohol dehydrogenase family)